MQDKRRQARAEKLDKIRKGEKGSTATHRSKVRPPHPTPSTFGCFSFGIWRNYGGTMAESERRVIII